MSRLKDKVVVVTGASRGIGAEIARLFAAEGGRVVCAARTLREGDHPFAGALETTVDEIRTAGGEAHAVAANIAEPAECEKLIATARTLCGPVDVLVNNAALTYYIPVKDYALNKWIRSWQVNLHAPFYLSQLVLADMIPRKSGAIVNISSGAAIRPLEGWSAYCAGKAAVHMMTRAIALETAEKGIRVFGFQPGTTDTDMQVQIRASRMNPVSQIPREKLTPVAEPAQCIVYLCSQAADNIAGQEVSLRDADFRRRVGLG